jgi:hypothetical protein
LIDLFLVSQISTKLVQVMPSPPSPPNLFHYATSELSQDAFLSWLLAWADPTQQEHDPELYKVAQGFVRRLLNQGDDSPIKSVRVLQQWNKVDVAAEVNDDYFLLIEDKTGTSQHSNQLLRYLEIAEQAYNQEKKTREVVPIYFKLEEQSDLSEVKAANYRHFRRSEMIDCLAAYQPGSSAQANNILTDFYQHICLLDEKIQSFRSLPIAQWDPYTWQGFFSWLQEALQPLTAGFCGWGYVANAQGGFMGFWWGPFKDSPFYLQLEEGRLTFRMYAGDTEDRAGARRQYQAQLLSLSSDYQLKPYGRTGQSMGLAQMEGDYRQPELGQQLDLAKTLELLKEMRELLGKMG